MFGRRNAPQGLSQSSTPGSVKHSVVMTGRCPNTSCRADLEVPHTFNASMGWIGKVQSTTDCTCGTTVTVSAYSG